RDFDVELAGPAVEFALGLDVPALGEEVGDGSGPVAGLQLQTRLVVVGIDARVGAQAKQRLLGALFGLGVAADELIGVGSEQRTGLGCSGDLARVIEREFSFDNVG